MLKRSLFRINYNFQCNLRNIDMAFHRIIAHVSRMPGCEPLKPLKTFGCWYLYICWYGFLKG